MYKSQNNETEIVLNYFSNFNSVKNVLSIGENDGITFSNSYDLIKNGWKGFLLEPSPTAFKKLKSLYENNDDVKIFEFGIANETGTFKFYESGGYKDGDDVALMSSLIDTEKIRWGNDTNWKEVNAKFYTFKDFISQIEEKTFDYITIDAEGYDFEILKQINLTDVQCKCLCIEHNGHEALLKNIIGYCSLHGLNNRIGYNPENIILVK